MPHIAILSASVRIGRKSHRVALHFKKYLEENALATTEILDLENYDFPIFHERLRNQETPAENVLDFAARVTASDGIIIVTPEYNGGYPASLKNAIDLLYAEWRRKPIAISTVSDGPWGGMQVVTSLQYSLWKIRSWTVPALFPVPKVQDAFDADGNASDTEGVLKRTKVFVDELLWCIEAKKRMDS
jgi:NAD(P)H-dependent FMN reductase